MAQNARFEVWRGGGDNGAKTGPDHSGHHKTILKAKGG
jgi:hypothetical protein